MDRGRVLLPDMAYWAPGRPFGRYPLVPPTLAVEVRSPGQPLTELREKCEFYTGHGVDVAWLVDPGSRTVEAFEAGAAVGVNRDGGSLTSEALPGFELAVSELFEALT